MRKNMLLSVGLALLGTAALPLSAPANAATPAKSKPAAAAPASSDIIFNSVFIFFRNDEATLTPLMVKQVTRAAELAKQGGATRIKITGYSDDAKHAEKLGQSRADAVKDVLIKQGIGADIIQTQPRVKAPPASNVGGPNPANHRVRITLIRALTAPPGGRDRAR
jgi:outer membrane protein OmpA-like peptidoglycan-associated protein